MKQYTFPMKAPDYWKAWDEDPEFRDMIVKNSMRDKTAKANAPAPKPTLSRAEIAARSAEVLKQARASVRHINDNYKGQENLRQIQQVRQHAQNEIDALQSAMHEAKQTANEGLKRFKPEVTPEALAKVQRWLAVMDPTRLSQQLMAEKDRAGLEALKAELPYYSKAHKIDWHDEQSMSKALVEVEEKLYSEDERAAHVDARDWETASGHLEKNHRDFSGWLKMVEVNPQNYNALKTLYTFDDQGMPNGVAQVTD